MRLFLAIMMVLISAMVVTPCAWSAERKVDLGYDEAWTRVLQVLAIEGVSVISKDKDNGIIQGSGSFRAGSSNFMCPRIKGNIDSAEYKITVVINKDSNDVIVNVAAKGSIRVIQTRRRLVVGKSSSYHEFHCNSTGGMEDLIINRLIQ